MSRFFRALKRGATAASDSIRPGPYAASGKGVSCSHCGNTEFAQGSAQLNTAGMSFLNLDWANRSATTLACTRCGLVHWFVEKPERLQSEGTD